MKKYILIAIGIIAPTNVFAAGTTVDTLLERTIPGWITALIAIGFTLALMFFIWGIAIFIMKSGNEEAASDGKRKMLWGITALFVITAIWGIVTFISKSLGVDNINSVDVPAIPGQGSPSGSTGGGVPCGPPFLPGAIRGVDC